MRRRIYVTCPLPPSVKVLLSDGCDVTFAGEERVPTAEEIVSGTLGHDALLVTTPTRVDRPLIERLPPSVKAIATYSVGNDHIDVDAAAEHGLAVFSTPDVLTDACAEATMLLMLGAARRATEAIALLREGRWQGWTPVQLNGVGLTGKRLGIVGMGRLGRAIADRARAFGMAVDYHNRSRLEPGLEAGAGYHASLEDLLRVSQFLVLACPATEQTRGLLNARRIGLLPPGAIVVNIGRGSVVVDDDLIAALGDGRVAGAGLDVFDGEPSVHPGYFRLPNVFMLPHVGSATIETREAMGQILLDGLRDFWAGRPAVNRLV
ncbi:2-hydroxyacid dehydrogenase [Telmatospirillum siberiense]|uniref:2-hydroxyacid dehydrogenase n=1 Tax=Telmatospirillum siberiense TaxID=382514 RepID=UPI001F52EC05|nr:D-glycerate dehydrogenase [Telmatospirillum siberiense]